MGLVQRIKKWASLECFLLCTSRIQHFEATCLPDYAGIVAHFTNMPWKVLLDYILPHLHRMMSSDNRETFYPYFIWICSRNWNHCVLNHMPWVRPLASTQKTLKESLCSECCHLQGCGIQVSTGKSGESFLAWRYQPSHHKKFLCWLKSLY